MQPQSLAIERKIDLINKADVGDGKKKKEEEDRNQGTEKMSAHKVFHLTKGSESFNGLFISHRKVLR